MSLSVPVRTAAVTENAALYNLTSGRFNDLGNKGQQENPVLRTRARLSETRLSELISDGFSLSGSSVFAVRSDLSPKSKTLIEN